MSTNPNSEQQMFKAIESLNNKVDSMVSKLDGFFGPNLGTDDINAAINERSLTGNFIFIITFITCFNHSMPFF